MKGMVFTEYLDRVESVGLEVAHDVHATASVGGDGGHAATGMYDWRDVLTSSEQAP